jgi:class 3 adenylate cyclase/HAMP domain-containing protein
MSPSVGHKLSLLVGVAVLLSLFGLGVFSYQTIETKLSDLLRKDTLDTATLLSSRVRNELKYSAEKARTLAAMALEDFKNPDDQIRFLEENLALDDQLLAISLHRKSSASQQQWTHVFRITRPESDPTHLTPQDFKDLDLKFPLNVNQAGNGPVDVVVGTLRDGTPILRMAFPIVRKADGKFTQVLSVEIKQERITAAFAEATHHFSFALDRTGRLMIQTDPTHFTFGEDLSYLPILQMAKSTEAPNGNLDYYELPGGSLQFGSFHRVGYGDLLVVTQAPKTYVMGILRDYTRQAGLIVGAMVSLCLFLTLVGTWGIVGSRLRRIRQVFDKLGEGHFAVSFPEKHSIDEIGDFARRLQTICNELEQREKSHGTFTKLKTKKNKQKNLTESINLKGERKNVTALCCQLYGLETIVDQADAEFFVHQLNSFNQAVTELVEQRNGIVDKIHNGCVVAYWGIPAEEKDDVQNVISVAFEIRKAVKNFNDKLLDQRLPVVTLKMGVHNGPVVTGQVGTETRMEYTAIGEAIEVAIRIQSFADQLGTDLLLTEKVISKVPKSYNMEKVSAGDDYTPALYEILGAQPAALHIRKKKAA